MKRPARWLLAAGAVGALTLAVLCHPQLRGAVLTPVQTAAAGAARAVSDVFGGSLRARCEAAEAELAAARREEAETDALRRQNDWYRALLGVAPLRDGLSLTEARVIATDPADPTGSFTLNAGTLDGVAAGAPVVTEAGLVGMVSEAGLTWAHVRSLYHPEMRVSVTVSRTGEDGLTAGRAADGTLALTSLPPGIGAQPGDLLLTSGLGGAYPEGLVVGRVAALSPSPDGLGTAGTAAGPAPVAALTRVMVVTDFAGKLS